MLVPWPWKESLPLFSDFNKKITQEKYRLRLALEKRRAFACSDNGKSFTDSKIQAYSFHANVTMSCTAKHLCLSTMVINSEYLQL